MRRVPSRHGSPAQKIVRHVLLASMPSLGPNVKNVARGRSPQQMAATARDARKENLQMALNANSVPFR